jgi:hypothetical protein
LTPLTGLIPDKLPIAFFYSNFLLNASCTIMYKRGDKGHPYLNPLLFLKKIDGPPIS